jgi:hypothetical protein
LGETSQYFDLIINFLKNLTHSTNVKGQVIPNATLLSSVFGLLQELIWSGGFVEQNVRDRWLSGSFLQISLRRDGITVWRLGELHKNGIPGRDSPFPGYHP